jgi:hypothetical protein
MKFTWKGVMPALTTQFDAQEQLDLNAFVHHLNAQIDAGIHGIVLGGTLGEASTLETAEKEALVKTACKFRSSTTSQSKVPPMPSPAFDKPKKMVQMDLWHSHPCGTRPQTQKL